MGLRFFSSRSSSSSASSNSHPQSGVWTTRTPTVPGYYWLRYLGETILVKLQFNRGETYIFWTGYDEGPDIEMVQARRSEWYSEPVVPPEY